MGEPIFSLAYTSVRANLIPRVVALWLERAASKSQVEIVLAVDEDDAESLKVAARLVSDWAANNTCGRVHVVINSGPKTCVSGWNTAAAATTGKVIICVADDFVPPKGWDTLLLGLQPADWLDKEHVVHTEDGYVHDIFVLSILTRVRYERYGYVFYPKYLSLFCDTEFGEVATRDGVVIQAMHLLFEHCHPDCHKRQRDTVDTVHASQERWNAGEQLFKFRRMLNFPVDDGPKAVQYTKKELQAEASKSDDFVAYMQVTRDDFCLAEVCIRLYEEGVRQIFWSEPDEYWSAEPIEAEFSRQLDAVAQELAVKVPDLVLRRKVFRVKEFRLPGASRIETETRVRNESLEWVRGYGYHHILVVDGDELWLKGTLPIIKQFALQGHGAISTHMVPSIGLPGYPVDQATDVAVVYIGSTHTFKCCRSPHIRQTIVKVSRIIHFTGTRRTMEETISKHRRGGHYDDPDYDFETWIKDVLPNIKPGFVYKWPNGLEGLHMYVKWQIWPRVRNWRPEELAEIPESLHPFLGPVVNV